MKIKEYIDARLNVLKGDIFSLNNRLEKLEGKVNAPKRIGEEKREEEKTRIIAREEIAKEFEAWGHARQAAGRLNETKKERR